jgi:hypothetical protein
MRRRLITFLVYALAGAAAIARETKPAATDDLKLNAFAERYNQYVTELKNGVIDLKQWERVKRAWEALE